MLPESNGKTVLLVDDSFIDLHLYSRPLKEAGYRPIVSLIGTEFGGIQVNEHPSLILLDYRLKSNVSVPDLVKILRDLFPNSLIVVFSVEPDLPAEMKGVVDGFLHKGDPARLAAEVQNLMDEKEYDRKSREPAELKIKEKTREAITLSKQESQAKIAEARRLRGKATQIRRAAEKIRSYAARQRKQIEHHWGAALWERVRRRIEELRYRRSDAA